MPSPLALPTAIKDITMQSVRSRKRKLDNEDAKDDSQQALALHPLLKKTGTTELEIAQLRNKIATDQTDLKGLLQQELQQTEEQYSQHRDELASFLSEALKKTNRHVRHAVTAFPDTKIAINPIFALAERVGVASQRVLSEYASFEKMVLNMRDETKDTVLHAWSRDLQETERLIDCGYKTALRNVRKVLDGKENQSSQFADEGKMEQEGKQPQENLDYGLLKSLRYVERGVKRMVKSLPKDGRV